MAVTRTVQELYTQGEWTNVWRKKMDESGNLTEGTEARGRDIRAGARKFDEASENLGENVKQDIKQKGNDAANWVNNKYTRNFESNIKEAIQKEKGFRKVTKLAQNGLGYVAAKVLEGSAKVSASILGGGSKLIVKTPASIGGFIARNIYFNKTVGLFWQGGRETTQIGIDVARTKPGKWMRDITRLSKLENTKYGKKTKNAIKHFSGEK